MSNDEPQQTEWENEVGLPEETTYVASYPSRKHAEGVDGGRRRAGAR